MKYYMLYTTETYGEACDLAGSLTSRTNAPGIVKVARPEAGVLEKPLRYMVLTTSETIAKSRELIDEVRAAVKPPRFAFFARMGDRLFDGLILSIEALTGLICKVKGIDP